jgi:hypothetical protein
MPVNFESVAVGALIGFVVGLALERFKASIWLRQERWRFKREIYEQLLRVLSDYRFATFMLKDGRAQLGEEVWKDRVALERRAMDELTRLSAVGGIFLSSNSKAALQEMYNLGAMAAQSASDWQDFRGKVWAVLKHTEETLTAEAKRDLKL